MDVPMDALQQNAMAFIIIIFYIFGVRIYWQHLI
jgi:hypothetical protein